MKMKTITIIILIIAVVFFVVQFISMRATKKTEGHSYTVLKTYDDFEIRKYEAAMFSYTVMKSDSYKNNSSKGFRALANYIFGGNDKNQKIAMTSPVTMTMSDSVTMKFKIPEGMEMEDLPKPTNENVRFSKEPEKTMAAIRFGGSSNDAKIAKYTQRLKDLLDKEKIEYTGNFSYLGYNPPFEVLNRRNEIVVEVVY